MLKNEDFLEEFKKSLSATTKSISKNDKIEINFTKENPSIDGNNINLTDPNIERIKKNLTYRLDGPLNGDAIIFLTLKCFCYRQHSGLPVGINSFIIKLK